VGFGRVDDPKSAEKRFASILERNGREEMTLKEFIETEMLRVGLRVDLGKGWDYIHFALKKREQSEKEQEEEE